MGKKILVLLLLLGFIFTMPNVVFAEDKSGWDSRDPWGEANTWYSGADYNGGTDSRFQGFQSITEDSKDWGSIGAILKKFNSMVEVLGTTVIVCVTTFLGIKYMYASAEGKAEVKDSLVTLLVACVFFFGWNGIWNMLFDSSSGSLTINGTDTTYEGFISNIYTILTYVAGILAVGAVVYIGIRYIFAGATGKAELKGKSIQFLIGFILAFCSLTVLHYISGVVLELFSGS